MKFLKKHKMLSFFMATFIVLSSANFITIFIMIYELIKIGVKLATI